MPPGCLGSISFGISNICSILAEPPAQFANNSDCIRCYNSRPTEPYSITNKGLQLELSLSSSEERLISEDGEISDRAAVALLECRAEYLLYPNSEYIWRELLL